MPRCCLPAYKCVHFKQLKCLQCYGCCLSQIKLLWERTIDRVALFLTVLEAGCLRSRCQCDRFLGKALFLACSWPSFHCIFIWKREKTSFLMSLLVRTIILSDRALSHDVNFILVTSLLQKYSHLVVEPQHVNTCFVLVAWQVNCKQIKIFQKSKWSSENRSDGLLMGQSARWDVFLYW